MTKEEARKNLEDYLKSNDVKLPITDGDVWDELNDKAKGI